MTVYVDSSAAVKLIAQEVHSEAMSAWAATNTEDLVSSTILRTETLRAAHRRSADAVIRARSLLDGVILLPITPDTCERAASLPPSSMRSLDAIHLATALSVVDEISGVLTYDDRLAMACREHGLPVLAPV